MARPKHDKRRRVKITRNSEGKLGSRNLVHDSKPRPNSFD